ncbi:unnamed protein product [Hermetia illucens]|uniref:Gonadal protein gdl n=1 Tax=Hermetia illucens TaxID=343691 RepID=A0A7R8YPR8_HERIL|nr:unnamed protein product [Hermetia illucens]
MEADFSPADTEQEPEAGSEAVLPETPSPEYLQRKLYFLLEQLKNMHQALPETYQMRISYELLTCLANCLLNDTIFEIVKGLMEIQHVTEKHLQQLRDQVENEYQIEVEEWISKIQDKEELEHILALMKIKHKKKLKETDIKLVAHLDQKIQIKSPKDELHFVLGKSEYVIWIVDAVEGRCAFLL